MTLRIALFLLLCAANVPVLAMEAEYATPDGDCPPAAAGDEQQQPNDAESPAAATPSGEQLPRPKDGTGHDRGTRWHSFLPGMFR